ncbi:hypothetical protein SNK03_004812 [Fusarium graminearum]|uniref:Chromosome 2, complete genome n=2 Tax=Gibberella zeae TaxID=5518 RepID=A0A0E0S062_GIBZE|nr:hypothetical protein FG05_08523 [Fusarium graminearum]PCD20530.1 hypothetical protein FGRA07_04682 [Fusarium graminearum]CAF3462523.1 unnamed protein product [Fusarium graminearum]CAF3483769.1 unnamed protein product [Fusarium graminearum]CAF3495708.1 unnamed protein product [Fusarium graminearum]
MALESRNDTMLRIMPDGKYTLEAIMVIICATISLYNGIELLALIFTSSRRRSDLYFWGLTAASVGILPYAVGWLILYLDLVGDVPDMVINDIGWMLVTTGQALVLYSRLELLVKNKKILCFTKWMIIVNAAIWHSAITVLIFVIGRQQRLDHNAAYVKVEKVQLTVFCVQNFVLSGIYLWKTTRIIRTKDPQRRTSRVLWHLVFINVLLILIDVALLAVGFTNNLLWQQGVKAVGYSVKLKLEFAILGKLSDYLYKGGELVTDSPMFGFVEMEPEPQPKSKPGRPIPAPETANFESSRKPSSASAAASSRHREFVSDETVVDKGKGVIRRTLDKGKSKCTDDCCNNGVRASS